MKKKKKQTNSKLQKFSLLLWIISIIFMILLGYLIYKANVLPLKYFLVIVICFALLMSIHGIFVLKKKTKTFVLIFLDLMTLVFMSCEALAIIKINETLAFLKANLGARYETNIYYVLSSKDATYENINDIAGMTIYSFKDLDDMSKVENELHKKVNATIEYKDNIAIGVFNSSSSMIPEANGRITDILYFPEGKNVSTGNISFVMTNVPSGKKCSVEFKKCIDGKWETVYDANKYSCIIGHTSTGNKLLEFDLNPTNEKCNVSFRFSGLGEGECIMAMITFSDC